MNWEVHCEDSESICYIKHLILMWVVVSHNILGILSIVNQMVADCFVVGLSLV